MIKEFAKSLSIYGILPVIGKFSGFFLIPIYTRIFNSYEFGIMELIITTANFFIFAMNLEFYAAIGRFFFEKKTITERSKLISTGLIMTLISSVIIVIIVALQQDNIIKLFIKDFTYRKEFLLTLIWMPLSALYTYMSVVPRYEKKPKQYIIVSFSHLIIRITSTIYFVLVLKAGIMGILLGHITGSVSAVIMYWVISSKYFKLIFRRSDCILILKYSVPLAPGAILIGLYNPTLRSLMASYFSIDTVGHFGFAFRLVTVFSVLFYAIRMSWKPILFERYKDINFNTKLLRLSKHLGVLLLIFGIGIILFSKEFILLIGTHEYLGSQIFLGGLVLQQILYILTVMRGFGPELEKKTYIASLTQLGGVVISIGLLVLIKDNFGAWGINVVIVSPILFRYIINVLYTERSIKVSFYSHKEMFLFLLLISMNLSVIFDINILIRIICYILLFFGFVQISRMKLIFQKVIKNYV